MKRRSQKHLWTLALVGATVLTLSTRAALQERDDDDRDRHEGREDHKEHIALRLPTGQYVTPTALDDADLQYLNPRLPGYPDFVAGEAVRSQLSPDGTTLAVMTA